MVENDATPLNAFPAPAPEYLQDLLLESAGFSEFLLGLTTISASLLGKGGQLLCAITVERDDAPATVASSNDAAQQLDELQYALGDGPCLTALRTQRPVLIKDLTLDPDWSDYAQKVAGHGVRSILAVPIDADPPSRAAFNCYSLTAGVFQQATVEAILDYAATISKSLRLALRLHAPSPVPMHLRSALASRAVVDAAVSLIMAQNRCSRSMALELLQVTARTKQGSLQQIALELLRTGETPSGS